MIPRESLGSDPQEMANDAVRSFSDAVYAKVTAMNLFGDPKYQTEDNQSMSQEISALLSEDIESLSRLVARHWGTKDDDRGRSWNDTPRNNNQPRDCFNLKDRQWLTVSESLQLLQSDRSTSERIVNTRDLDFELSRIAKAVKTLFNDAIALNSFTELASRDKSRHELVQEWKDLSAIVDKLIDPSLQSDEKISKLVAVVEPRRNALKPQMEQPMRIVHTFPFKSLEGKPNGPDERLPHQQASDALESFIKDTLVPVLRAKHSWAGFEQALRMKVDFGLDVSETEVKDAEKAEGEVVVMARTLRQKYNEWIPLLRFGFPELQAKIYATVQRHCLGGSLRLDVSMTDWKA